MPAAADRPLRSAWIEINLDALRDNLGLLRDRLGSARIVGVVKADGYGHGAAAIGRALERFGIDWLGVAFAEEGARLRAAAVTVPIMVLGPASEEELDLFPRYGLTPLVSSIEQLERWLAWSVGREVDTDIHLEVDTGMARLGVDLRELSAALRALRAQRRLRLTGIASHFAAADELDNPDNDHQESRFADALAQLDAEERARVSIHFASSAAALHRPSSRFDLARVGLALYGLDPAREEERLRPVMSAHCRIEAIRDLPEGTRVGYNGRWQAARPSRIGVVGVGYGDGYPWRLTGQAEVVVRGRRARVVGAVSMDTSLVDITDAGAEVGDQVTLLGGDESESISAWEWARWAGTIPYEVLTGLGLRMQRRYLPSERAGV